MHRYQILEIRMKLNQRRNLENLVYHIIQSCRKIDHWFMIYKLLKVKFSFVRFFLTLNNKKKVNARTVSSVCWSDGLRPGPWIQAVKWVCMILFVIIIKLHLGTFTFFLSMVIVVSLRRIFKLILARWRSRSIICGVRERQPIMECLESRSLKSHLSSFLFTLFNTPLAKKANGQEICWFLFGRLFATQTDSKLFWPWVW